MSVNLTPYPHEWVRSLGSLRPYGLLPHCVHCGQRRTWDNWDSGDCPVRAARARARIAARATLDRALAGALR